MRHYRAPEKEFINAPVNTTTCLFRHDLDWRGFVDLIKKTFAGKEKVNAYSLASSDGSEAYTYAICIFDKMPKTEHSKYLPIIASDIDEEVIKAGKTGKINLSTKDLVKTELHLNRSKMYFKHCGEAMKIKNNKEFEQTYYKEYNLYEPINKLKNAVKFKQVDILTQLKKIKDEGNSIIFCRNVAPYLSNNYILDIVETAKKVLKSGSLFIIGDYDICSGIDYILRNSGFVEQAKNIFKRV